MTLTGLIGLYVRQNWRPYLLSALMLASVSALTVFIPRQVGHVVDGLAAGKLTAAALLTPLGLVLLAGVAMYFLRVAWRLQLFAASYRLGAELRARLYARLCLQGPHFFQQKRIGDDVQSVPRLNANLPHANAGKPSPRKENANHRLATWEVPVES